MQDKQKRPRHQLLLCTLAGNEDSCWCVLAICPGLDGAVQQCLKLCSSVDLVYKLLIQDIHPVLGMLPSLSACLLICRAVVLCYM